MIWWGLAGPGRAWQQVSNGSGKRHARLNCSAAAAAARSKERGHSKQQQCTLERSLSWQAGCPCHSRLGKEEQRMHTPQLISRRCRRMPVSLQLRRCLRMPPSHRFSVVAAPAAEARKCVSSSSRDERCGASLVTRHQIPRARPGTATATHKKCQPLWMKAHGLRINQAISLCNSFARLLRGCEKPGCCQHSVFSSRVAVSPSSSAVASGGTGMLVESCGRHLQPGTYSRAVGVACTALCSCISSQTMWCCVVLGLSAAGQHLGWVHSCCRSRGQGATVSQQRAPVCTGANTATAAAQHAVVAATGASVRHQQQQQSQLGMREEGGREGCVQAVCR